MSRAGLPAVLALLTLVAAPREVPPPPPVDTASIDAFWRLADTLRAGATPTAAQWQQVFESDGYRTYVRSARMEQMFREVWSVTLGGSPDAEREALRAANPGYAHYLQHFSAAATRADALKAFQASLASSDFQQRARERAMAYLPAEAGRDPRWPRIVPVLAEPDGKAVGDIIVIDLLLAADFGSFFTEFVAHEMHHVYGRRLRRWQPRADDDRPEERLLHAIDQLSLEGIADLIDKPVLLANGGPFAERYRAALEQAPADIGDMNTLLEGIAADGSAMRENAAAFWKGLPFAGHTTGFYMAQAIRDGLGAAALEECVRNPFRLFSAYNAAVERLRAQGQERPWFSERALAVIAALERTHSANAQ